MNERNEKGEEVNKKQEEKINLLEAHIEALETTAGSMVIEERKRRRMLQRRQNKQKN